MNLFQQKLAAHGMVLRRSQIDTLQINVGKLCNQTCSHCHVDAGPKRKEIITRETLEKILIWLEKSSVLTVDITGGAPELVPDFRDFVRSIRQLTPRRRVMDRCNLTVLFEPGQEDLADFLAEQEVEIIASLPCYSEENVDEQRGEGVFAKSIRALQLLNQKGYGAKPTLPLNLVYNPLGAKLPGAQAELEADYKAELQHRFGITFNQLYTITNMPIARFAAELRHTGQYEAYLELLAQAFNPQAVEGLMCRRIINVGWRGEVYDCDFNQMLGLQWREQGRPLFLWDVSSDSVGEREIQMANHCLGCTAGAGSSCAGALATAA